MLIGNAIFSLFEVTKVCFELMKFFNSELFVLFSKLDILSIKDFNMRQPKSSTEHTHYEDCKYTHSVASLQVFP